MVALRTGRVDDAPRMAELAELKREQYKHHAPVFHRPKPGTRGMHASFLVSQIEHGDKHVALVHEADDGHLDGFLIATLVPAPPVYDPGGLTCLVDDFMVEESALWASAGRELLVEAIRVSEPKGAVQTVVVCGPLDTPKRTMLIDSGHIVASEWFTKPSRKGHARRDRPGQGYVSRRHRFRSIGCALALAASFLLVSGCGGENGEGPAEPAQIESPAQRDWESQIGQAWEEYEDGFIAGWVEGCKAVHKAVAAEYDEDYADAVLVECSGAPPSGYGGAPIQVPADPRAAGHADGVAEACYVPPEVTRPVQPEC